MPDESVKYSGQIMLIIKDAAASVWAPVVAILIALFPFILGRRKQEADADKTQAEANKAQAEGDKAQKEGDAALIGASVGLVERLMARVDRLEAQETILRDKIEAQELAHAAEIRSLRGELDDERASCIKRMDALREEMARFTCSMAGKCDKFESISMS